MSGTKGKSKLDVPIGAIFYSGRRIFCHINMIMDAVNLINVVVSMKGSRRKMIIMI